MKIRIAIICLLLIPLTALARENRIGFYADPEAEIDEVTIPSDELVPVYLVAHAPSYREGIRVAEFGVENWPGSPGDPYGIASVDWMTPLVIGELGDPFIALGFPDDMGVPDENGNLLMAIIRFYSVNQDWLRSDLEITVIASNCGGGCDYEDPLIMPVGVYDHFDYVDGDTFTINPSEANATGVAQGSFSNIKALY